MEGTIRCGEFEFTVDLLAPHDLSIPINPVVTNTAAYTHPGTAPLPPAAAPASAAPTGAAQYTIVPRPTVSIDAFGIPSATAKPLEAGGWVGAVHSGSSVNCWQLTLCAHGNGTHTECVGHITADHPHAITVEHQKPAHSLHPALLLTVVPEPFADCGGDTYSTHALPTDRVVSRRAITTAIERLRSRAAAAPLFGAAPPAKLAVGQHTDAKAAGALLRGFGECVVLRTNAWRDFPPKPPAAATAASAAAPVASASSASSAVPSVVFSSRDPPYLTREAAQYLVDALGVKHLCVDLPSVDRESDGGLLLVHRIVFRHATPFTSTVTKLTAAATATAPPAAPPAVSGPYTVTELCHFPSATAPADGAYLMNLSIAPIAMDAAPSRPVLFAAKAIKVVPK